MAALTPFDDFKVPAPVNPELRRLRQEAFFLDRKIKALGNPAKWNPNTPEGRQKNIELFRLINDKSAAEKWILEMDPRARFEHAKQLNFSMINAKVYKPEDLLLSDNGWPIFQDVAKKIPVLKPGKEPVAQKIPRLKAVKKLTGSKRSSAALLKVKGNGVHAEALPGGSGPVVEDVSQVGPAAAADDLGPLRKKRSINPGLNGAVMDGPSEAGPPSS